MAVPMNKAGKKRTFVVFTEYGEMLDVAMQLQNEGNDVVMHIPEKEFKTIGEGIVEKVEDWWMCIGEDYIWLFDGCSHGKLQDWLRSKGEAVFGGSEQGDRLENERQLAQKWFAKAGFIQPESQNFKDIDEAIAFVVEHPDQQWVLKQNSDAPKSLNHVGKFEGNSDMLFHLQELKKKWNEADFGQFDCDLMEKVEGLEVAISVFFNGTEFMKNKKGKIVAYINFEEKKESERGMGQTTGETGTTFLTTDEDGDMFKSIMSSPKITEVLKASKFRGVFDINCIKTDKGMVALEPTMRPGIPGSSYEFIEGLNMPTGDMIEAVARGTNLPIELKPGAGMVLVVTSKPFPLEAEVESGATSIGEKLWILKDGNPVDDFDDEQKKHIHLENFQKKDGNYLVATTNGYLLTTTATGKTIKDVREKLIKYTKDNLYLADFKVRHDIGQRVEDYYTK